MVEVNHVMSLTVENRGASAVRELKSALAEMGNVVTTTTKQVEGASRAMVSLEKQAGVTGNTVAKNIAQQALAIERMAGATRTVEEAGAMLEALGKKAGVSAQDLTKLAVAFKEYRVQVEAGQMTTEGLNTALREMMVGMRAAQQQAVEEEKTAKRVAEANEKKVASYTRMLDAIHPLAAEQRRWAEEEKALAELRTAGVLDERQYAEALTYRTRAHNEQAEAKRKLMSTENGLNFSRNQALMLEAALINSGQALAAGMDVTRVIVMEGAQAVGAFAMGSNAMSKAIGAMLNPVALTAAAVVALGAGFAYAASAAAAQRREMEMLLRVTGGFSGLSSSGAESMAAQAAGGSVGTTVGAYRDMITSAIRGGSLKGSDISNILAGVEDFAKVTGTSVSEAFGALSKAMEKPYEGARKLNEAFHFLSNAELENIRHLDESGRKSEAVALATEKLNDRTRGAAREVGFLAAMFDALAKKAGEAYEAVTHVNTTEEELARINRMLQTPNLGLGSVGGEGVFAEEVLAEGSRREGLEARRKALEDKIAAEAAMSGLAALQQKTIEGQSLAAKLTPEVEALKEYEAQVRKLSDSLAAYDKIAERTNSLSDDDIKLRDQQRQALERMNPPGVKELKESLVSMEFSSRVGQDADIEEAQRKFFENRQNPTESERTTWLAKELEMRSAQNKGVARRVESANNEASALRGLADSYSILGASTHEAEVQQRALTDSFGLRADLMPGAIGATRALDSAQQALAASTQTTAAQQEALNTTLRGSAYTGDVEWLKDLMAALGATGKDLKDYSDAAEATLRIHEALKAGTISMTAADRDMDAVLQSLSASQKNVNLEFEKVYAQKAGTSRLDTVNTLYRDTQKLKESQAEVLAQQKAYGAFGLGADAERAIAINKAMVEAANKYGSVNAATSDETKKRLENYKEEFTRLYDMQTALERQKLAWQGVGDAITNAVERPLQSAIDLIMQGQGATIKWANVFKSMMTSIQSDLVKMAVINPVKNALGLGSYAASIWDIGGGGTVGGAVGGTAPGGGAAPQAVAVPNGSGGFDIMQVGGLAMMGAQGGGFWGEAGSLSGYLFGNAGGLGSAEQALFAAGQAPAGAAYSPLASEGLLGSNGTLLGSATAAQYALPGLGVLLGAGMQFGQGNVAGGVGTLGGAGAGLGIALAAGLSGPIGLAVGGVVGGLLGGLFGGTQHGPSADAGVQSGSFALSRGYGDSWFPTNLGMGKSQVDVNRFYALLGGSAHHGGDASNLLTQTGAFVNSLNEMIAQYQLTIMKPWSGLLISGENGNPGFATTDAMMKDIANRKILGGSGAIGQVLQRGGWADTDTLKAAMSFAGALDDSVKALNETTYQTKQRSLDVNYQQSLSKAKMYGISTEGLTAVYNQETLRNQQDANMAVEKSAANLTARLASLNGDTIAAVAATLKAQQAEERIAAERSKVVDMTKLAAVQEAEYAQAIQKASVQMRQASAAIYGQGLTLVGQQAQAALQTIRDNLQAGLLSAQASGADMSLADPILRAQAALSSVQAIAGLIDNKISALAGLVAQSQAFRDTVTGMQNARLTPQQAYDRTIEVFRNDLAAAKAGDLAARSRLTAEGQAAVSAESQYTGGARAVVYSEVTTALSDMAMEIDAANNINADQAKEQINELSKIRLNTSSMLMAYTDSADALATAMAAVNDDYVNSMQVLQGLSSAIIAAINASAAAVSASSAAAVAQVAAPSTQTPTSSTSTPASTESATSSPAVGGGDGLSAGWQPKFLRAILTAPWDMYSAFVEQFKPLVAARGPQYMSAYKDSLNSMFINGDYGSVPSAWGEWALSSGLVPGFASGGDFAGGLRLVGERGPEIEATGAARYWDAGTTAGMLRGGRANDNDVVSELKALRAEVALLRRVTGIGLDVVAAGTGAVADNTMQLVTAARRPPSRVAAAGAM